MKWLTLNDYRASNELHTVAVISWHFWMIIRPAGTKLFHFNPTSKRCPLNCYFSSFFTPSVLQTMLPRKSYQSFSSVLMHRNMKLIKLKISNLNIKLLSFWVDYQFWVVMFDVVTAPSNRVDIDFKVYAFFLYFTPYIWRSRKTPQAMGMAKLKCASLE